MRTTLRDLYPKFMSELDREAVERSARRLDILQGGSLLLNTEHEMNLFYDYCLYNYNRSGLNVIQRSFNHFVNRYTGEKRKLFEAAKNGYFAYLEIVEPVNETGFVVYDREREQEHLMIDSGLSQVAHSEDQYTIVTHIIRLDDFIITTGASTPIPIHTEAGSKVQCRFEKYLKVVKAGEGTTQEIAQYITDMYKICLHENITGQVVSPTVPFGREALEKRVMASNAAH